jgi:hypothetical protein
MLASFFSRSMQYSLDPGVWSDAPACKPDCIIGEPLSPDVPSGDALISSVEIEMEIVSALHIVLVGIY